MKRILNFVILSLPQKGQWRLQAALCRALARVLSGCPADNPTASQAYLVFATTVLNLAADSYTAEVNGDLVQLDWHSRNIRQALSGAIAAQEERDPFFRSPDGFADGKEIPQKEIGIADNLA